MRLNYGATCFLTAAAAAATTLVVVVSNTSCDNPASDDRIIFEAQVKPTGDALDLLFLVNSTPYIDRAVELTSQTSEIINVVFHPDGNHQRVVDLHVGVIDMDVGAGGYDIATCNSPSMGALWRQGTCQHFNNILNPPFLTYSVDEPNDGGPSDSNGIALWSELECLMSRYSVSCELEQPLQALRLAMTERVEDGTNAGFFREGAALAVVIISDEDDCSTLDQSFFDPERDDLASFVSAGLRCFANADQLEPVANFVEMLLSQRPPGRIVTAGWLTVPPSWDGDLDVLRPDPELDWHTATLENFELCPEVSREMVKSPRLAEFIQLTGGEELIWSQCDNTIYLDGMETIGRVILDHLDPVACLPSSPPEESRCEVALRQLDPDDPCPEATLEASPGVCRLEERHWELVETESCTELRAVPEVEIPNGASLEIRCF